MKKIFILCVITLNIFNLSFAIESSDWLIPRKVLFGNQDKSHVRLSYSGQYIAYIAPVNDVLNIWITETNNLKKSFPITHEKIRGISSFSWTYNDMILFSKDTNGDENFRIYSYNIKNKKTNLLTPRNKVKSYILKISPTKTNDVLISMNERNPKFFDIYQYNLKTLEKKLIFKNDEYLDFVVDNNLNVCFGYLIDDLGNKEYHQFKKDKKILFTKIDQKNSSTTSLLNLNDKGDILYILDSRKRDTSALKKINLLNNKTSIIASNNKSDIEIFTIHPTKHTIQAVSSNYTKTKYTVLDKTIEKDIKYLTNLNQGNLFILSRTLDDTKWLIAYENDNSAIKYFIYDRKKRIASFLFYNRNNIKQYKLANMKPIIIKARDGLNLVSYITFPYNTKFNTNGIPTTKNPLVLYVHGGPWLRDSWGFNTIHQWLANRGYIVLSINFRGSKGFGKKFLNAGDMEWGRKMHYDLIDGVNWAIKNHITSIDKIAIMGGSYGGYATLIGLTMTPDVFSCGIDIVGPSNLITLIESVPPYWKPVLGTFRKRIGPWDTTEDKKFLDSRSPLTYTANIKKPLFIAHGAFDPRVKKTESDQIVKKMQYKKLPVLYALYENEGHGFMEEKNKLSFFAMTEYFLSKVLKGEKEIFHDHEIEGSKFILNFKKIKNKEMLETAINKQF